MLIEMGKEDVRAQKEIWRGDELEFDRLKELALGLGVCRVLISPPAVYPEHQGMHLFDHLSFVVHTKRTMQEWLLKPSQVRSINHGLEREQGIILMNFWSENPTAILAHEIGHDIHMRLAGFSFDELASRDTPTASMKRETDFTDPYFRDSVAETYAECFSEFLTQPKLRAGRLRLCQSLLLRVKANNRQAYDLIERYRQSIIRGPIC